MNEQADYVGSTAEMKHKCDEYVKGGRFFYNIKMYEGEEMFNVTAELLGDEVLMYASDFPHAECRFPESPDRVLRWSSLSKETMQKLMWDNAIRFYKQT